jgi:hypothetical protein
MLWENVSVVSVLRVAIAGPQRFRFGVLAATNGAFKAKGGIGACFRLAYFAIAVSLRVGHLSLLLARCAVLADAPFLSASAMPWNLARIRSVFYGRAGNGRFASDSGRSPTAWQTPERSFRDRVWTERSYCSRIFPFFLWRRLTVNCFARGDIDHAFLGSAQ